MSLSDDVLRSALERIGVEAPVRFDEVTGSTQRTALEMASAGSPEWTLVAAGHQTQGRGRMGRSWVDVPGSALMFSLVLRPELGSERAGLLSLLAGTAMARAGSEIAGVTVGCKWPNDLLVGDRKVGGILAESVLDGGAIAHVVLGMGVNLRIAPDLSGAAALDAEPDRLLEAFLARFARHYEPAHPAFAGAVVEDYRHVCSTLGRRVRASAASGLVVEGDAVDVDEEGGLVVRAADVLETVRFGEIEHLDALSSGGGSE